MKMKEVDIEMQNTLDITNMSQKEIEDAIHAVLSGQKTFAEVAADNPGPIPFKAGNLEIINASR
jgi:MinD-like ATPase involved in chromosome partitioning or flagellar assembly